MKTAEITGKRRAHWQVCKFCGGKVNLTDEGMQYRDGSAAHEDCHDQEEFDRENAADLRD